ncbi:MAG: hypothetical protein GXO56_04665 [Chloroflexi bacterium]|nr:hypothetical protein [Chloroflexota bacterium]
MLQQRLAQIALSLNSPAHRAIAKVFVFALLVLISLLFPHHHEIRQLADGYLIGGGQPA